MKKKKGLTLIELLAVIAIIAILFILLIPQVSSAIDKARVSGVQTDLRSYEVSLKGYLLENIGVVHEESKINQYLDKQLQFTNLKSKELNPWGEPYELVIDGENVYVHTKTNSSNGRLYGSEYRLEDGTHQTTFVGFDNEVRAADNGNGDGSNTPNPTPNYVDVDNDGWDDNTFLPNGVVSNMDKSMFEYTINGDSITITAYKGSVRDAILPATIDGLKVTVIDRFAFCLTNVCVHGKNTGVELTSLVVPNTVVSLGENAFFHNDISELTLPSSLTTIHNSVFSNNLLMNVVFPEGLTSIGDYAFNTNFLTQVTFPSTLTHLGQQSFYINPDLKTIIDKSGYTFDSSHFNSAPNVSVQ